MKINSRYRFHSNLFTQNRGYSCFVSSCLSTPLSLSISSGCLNALSSVQLAVARQCSHPHSLYPVPYYQCLYSQTLYTHIQNIDTAILGGCVEASASLDRGLREKEPLKNIVHTYTHVYLLHVQILCVATERET